MSMSLTPPGKPLGLPTISSKLPCAVLLLICFFLITYIHPIIEFGSQVWNTGYLTDLCFFDRIQRSWAKEIQGLEHLSYGDRFKVEVESRKRLFACELTYIELTNIVKGRTQITQIGFIEPHEDTKHS